MNPCKFPIKRRQNRDISSSPLAKKKKIHDNSVKKNAKIGKTICTVDVQTSSDSDVEPSCSVKSFIRKGPPTKSLQYFKDIKHTKKHQTHKDSDSEESDFELSNESDSDDSPCTSSEDNMSTDEEIELQPVSQSNDTDWFQPRGSHMEFNYDIQNTVHHNIQVGENVEPVDFLNLFIDESVIDWMVNETNRNAEQVLQQKSLRSKSRLLKWSATDHIEMKRFIALLLWMGLVKMPTIHSYWRVSDLYRNSMASAFTRNRFQMLLCMWHFSDNQKATKDNKISKISDFLELLVSKFTSAREPGKDMVIDETMILFRGRLSFRQYIPGKAHKYCIKLFKLCDSEGYTYNILVCCINYFCIVTFCYFKVAVELLLGTAVVNATILYNQHTRQSNKKTNQNNRIQRETCGQLFT